MKTLLFLAFLLGACGLSHESQVPDAPSVDDASGERPPFERDQDAAIFPDILIIQLGGDADASAEASAVEDGSPSSDAAAPTPDAAPVEDSAVDDAPPSADAPAAVIPCTNSGCYPQPMQGLSCQAPDTGGQSYCCWAATNGCARDCTGEWVCLTNTAGAWCCSPFN